MANSRVHKEDLIVDLLRVFREKGYEGATLTELAKATGLGKASLYHHFPGGKDEMVAMLLRMCIAELQKKAFRHLDGKGKRTTKIEKFLDGFDSYVEGGEHHCLIAVLAQGSAVNTYGPLIQNQFRDWQTALAQVLDDTGESSKKSQRKAQELLVRLYGALVTMRLTGSDKTFRQTLKRLRKDFT